MLPRLNSRSRDLFVGLCIVRGLAVERFVDRIVIAADLEELRTDKVVIDLSAGLFLWCLDRGLYGILFCRLVSLGYSFRE